MVGKSHLSKSRGLRFYQPPHEESKREDSGSNELQRGFSDEVKDCIAKLENRKVAGTDEIVNGFLKYGVDGIVTMIVKLYNWIWKNEDTQTVERTCSSKPLSRKETRLLSTVGKIFCRHSE